MAKLENIMNKIFYLVALVAALTSCSKAYKIEGTSSVASLDGSKLFLTAIKDGEAKHIDSCEVVHGEFQFNGILDTVKIAMLMMDGFQMPLVLEEGPIQIKIDNATQKVTGTPLNETLYAFMDKMKTYENQMVELNHKQSQMLLDGVDEETIARKLMAEAEVISKDEDKLITDFITENFDNALGPCVFMMITSGGQYPILTPQLEFILSKATDTFKNDPYVKEYCRVAREIEARQQGLIEDNPVQAAPADTAAATIQAPSLNVEQGGNNEKE